ncbi:serine hydrolase [Synechococcus sp. PROS-7-1]|uniref:serine hydrolase n=1 Tax=Synechococcus sp. PROS-7-1 TaxID=1442556 RepID=UPI001648A5A3|nr:serine hydrolase [Synechococcus sp. PROS-7-1]
MAFYRPEPTMQEHLAALIDRLAAEGRPGLHDRIAVTWVRYDQSSPATGSGCGASWADQKLIYPASVVKLMYAVAAEHWLERDFLPDSEEFRRALLDMLADSSNDATGLVVDLLTGTTSGPALRSPAWEQWQQQRLAVNRWLWDLGWPELDRVNCCQKTWGEGPYGREKAFYGEANANRNALCTAAVGRMLEAVMTDGVLSPPACQRLKTRLLRSLDQEVRAADPENQVDGFLGEGLPAGSTLWSKAGWMSQARHDAAWWASGDEAPNLLVVFTEGAELANDEALLPAIAHNLAFFATSA